MRTKIIILTAIFFMLRTTGFGQDIAQREVPSIILNKFKKDYSKATEVDWEKENNLYQVEFEVKNREHDIWYDKLGAIVKQEEEISPQEVPGKIRAVIKKEFPGLEVDEAKKVRENGRTEYHLELESRAEEWDVIFTPDGEVVSKIAD